MRNAIRLMTAAAIAAVMTLSFGGSAQAYPDDDPFVKISGGELIGGRTFTFSTESNVDCTSVTVSYDGKSINAGSGTSTTGSVKTKVVSKRTPTTITVTCEYEPVDALGRTAEVQAAATVSGQNTVVLLPQTSGSDSGALPSTGGSSLWILYVGAGLVLVGGGAIVLARRRSH